MSAAPVAGRRMAAVALGLSALRKDYGATTVVDGIDLTAEPGELLSLLGPSGCGKTTTLRMIAGLVEPSAGEIHFGRDRVTAVPVHRRNVGVLFQSYALFPHMDVAGNVAFGLEMRGRDRRRIRAQVEEALGLVQLTAFAERYPHELSGGQQQRVALARALAIEPRVLLLDEPFAALDRKLREEMQIQIKDLQQRLGITTVMVTHDQDEALTMSDRVAVMNEGRIEQCGTPADVYDRPATRFVARFIGTSNLFHGRVERRRSEEALVRTEGGLALTARGVPSEATEATLCLRPEAITLAPCGIAEPTDLDHAVGTLSRIIHRGATTEFHLQLRARGALIACRAGGETGDLRTGQTVVATWSPERVRVLL